MTRGGQGERTERGHLSREGLLFLHYQLGWKATLDNFGEVSGNLPRPRTLTPAPPCCASRWMLRHKPVPVVGCLWTVGGSGPLQHPGVVP